MSWSGSQNYIRVEVLAAALLFGGNEYVAGILFHDSYGSYSRATKQFMLPEAVSGPGLESEPDQKYVFCHQENYIADRLSSVCQFTAKSEAIYHHE